MICKNPWTQLQKGIKKYMKRSRLSSLAVLALAMVTILAVACGSEQSPPPSATTENVESPQATSPSATATLESETETIGREVSGGDGPLRVISSRSAAAPLGPNPGRAGGLSLFPLSQGSPLEVGLTVSVNGSVTVEADEAYVVVFPPQNYGPSGPEQIASEDRNEVIAKLAEIGIDKEDIDFGSQQPYGPPSVSVEVDVDALPDIGEAVLDAVEVVLKRSERHGVRFSISPKKCDEALALARREAIPQAHRSAADLAAALDVNLGRVEGALEFPAINFNYGPRSVDTCGGQFSDPNSVTPLDSEPKIEVSVGLQVTYALEQ